ncbi:polysaccharide lyase family protein [Saccharicrinis sp. FJH2]|uniref:polysaccharide lyase family protein n=1 Tax=Saccharicrinis sp. FJH65 TaxID=3344659 RepID=UPI0035F39695
MRFLNVILLVLIQILFVGISAQNIAVVSGNTVAVDNGMIEAQIDGGKMISVNMKGEANLLNNGGYGYFSYNDDNGFFSPSALQPGIKVNTAEIADIYFRKVDNFDIEMHFVFRKNECGFYTYFVVSDAGLAGKSLGQLRFAFRVDKDIFDYAWTVERQGPMIHPDVLANYVEEIQDATFLLQDGSIYTKYDWCTYKIYDDLHGLMGNGTGVWNIEASHEYISGGPTMQETTLHGTNTTPILLCPFLTGHFGSETITLQNEYTQWSKIFGPAFIYINSGTNEEIIADARQKTAELKSEWPYQWLEHDLFARSRGNLNGKLDIKGRGTVDSAMVVLCKAGPSWIPEEGRWQRQPYDYFFWAEADENGNFKIEKIIPGTYTLYAYTQKGKLIDELRQDNVLINEGNNDAGIIQWDAKDREKIIFQIGIADHKSGEYKLGNLPRAYGRWKESPYELTYSCEVDTPRENWYYCQRVNSTWDIKFNIADISVLNDPVIKVALAGVDAGPHLDLILNGETVSVNDLWSDSGIRRSSLTSGKYKCISCDVDKRLLQEGENTLQLRSYGSAQEYKGIMYDAIILEADTSKSVHDPSLASLTVSAGQLSPAFNYRIGTYVVSVPQGTTVLPTVSALAVNENAMVHIDNVTEIPDTAYVHVTADDGVSNATYRIIFDYATSIQTAKMDVEDESKRVDVYTVSGRRLRSGVEKENALKGLENGIYIVGQKKVVVTESK